MALQHGYRAVTGTSLSSESVVLPFASLALLGAGPDGAALLSEFRWSSASFEADFRAMLDQLAKSEELDAPVKAVISQRIAEAARLASGRLSITSMGGGLNPTYVLHCGEQALVARLQDFAVEWLLIELSEVASVVRAAIDSGAPDVLVNASQASDVTCSLYVKNGHARLAARDALVLTQLREAGAVGLEGLVRVLLDAISSHADTNKTR